MLLRELRRGARAAPETIERLRERRLREALEHARAHVPLYRRLWDGRALDLASLPVISRAHAREALASGELHAEGVHAPRAFPSSGTGGDPLAVPRGATEARMWRAVALRAWFEHGHRWRDSTVHFDRTPGGSHPLQRLGISRSTWISPDLGDDELLRRFRAARRDFVVGTPTVFRRVCRAIEADAEPMPSPRVVFAAGEVLDRGTAELVQRTLGVAPIDLYGLTEVGYVAWECERREHLHVNAETCLVELLADGRPAEPGELASVVVTDLRGRTAPMIRYDTGDVARAVEGPCACGRTLPLMGRVEGRASESVGSLTTRELVDKLAPLLPDEYEVHRLSAGGYELRARGGEPATLKTRVVA